MKILVLTTLYPNQAMPSHGVFVENRLRAVKQKSGADIRVVAPVPWFPSQLAVFGAWANWAKVPAAEQRHGVEITHPRYFVPPKIGMNYAPIALEKCFAKAVDDLQREGWEPDLIDAHYFYPDGVAAVRLARRLQKPVTVTARGTDINLIPKYARQKKMIVDAACRANASITVADALRDEMIRLGAIPEKITTLRNGVDLDIFQPVDQAFAREQLSLTAFAKDGPLLASVGHLIDRKGHNLAIEALNEIPDARLVIAGDGPQRHALEKTAGQAGVSSRVRFLGRLPHEALAAVYSAADLLILASSREGWPNVLLEAMACGTPCVATPVWGSGEVITSKHAGRLCKERSATAIADATKSCLADNLDRSATRRYAEGFSWDETAVRVTEIFTRLIETNQRRNALICKPAIITHPSTKPRSIVTIDTEEQFDWSEFQNTKYTVCDIAGLDRFQNICDSKAIKPIYFLTWPIITTGQTSAFFKSLIDKHTADLGLHMHQWVNPPFWGLTTPYYSFQKNIPPEALYQKFQLLIAEFEKTFGFSPDLHRAGRYGIAPESYAQLGELGLRYDFSPSAGFDFAAQGGPDFSAMNNDPFIITSPDNAELGVNVLPISGATAIKHTRRFSMGNRSPGFNARRDTGSRILERGGIAMRLSPEGVTYQDMLALTRYLIEKNTTILTFTFHSTTLTPSATDYTGNADAVDQFLDTCERYFKAFQNDFGGEFIDAQAVRTLFSDTHHNDA